MLKQQKSDCTMIDDFAQFNVLFFMSGARLRRLLTAACCVLSLVQPLGSEHSAKADSSSLPKGLGPKIANPNAKDTSEIEPKIFENVTVIEKLGSQIDLSTRFRNESNVEVQLSDYLRSGAPLIVTLNYFSCGTLCSLQLGGFAKSISQMSDKQRQDLRILTISFDPSDTPALAGEKKSHFLKMIPSEVKPKWDFLVGTQASIQKITQSLGFQYNYDPETKQFAHTAAIFFLSPLGIVARYLYGIEFSNRDIRFAWIDASEGRFGTSLERLILRCFHYDANTGKYTTFAMSVVRWSGLATVLILGFALYLLWRKEKHGLLGGLNSAV
jgi:protein SCO1